jgi:nucleoid-associated protein YgaU
LAACSSQQQEEEGLEVSGQDQQAADNQAAADNEAADNAAGEEGGNDEASNEQGAEDNAGGGEDNAAAGGGNATENDLQEIIQEMNGQQAGGDAGAGGDAPADAAALAQDAAAPAPVDSAMAAPAEAAPAQAEAAPAAAPAAAAPAGNTNPIAFQPGGSPAGPGLPEAGSKMAYIVQKGDTLGKISSKIYGSPSRWNEIAQLSGMQNPNRIYAGDVVYYTLDESAVAFATAYEKAQRSEEQVKPGDTLATIAQRVYGTTAAWRSIWRQNDKIDNPDIVPPGTTIFYLSDSQLSAALEKAKSQLSTVQLAKRSGIKAKTHSGKTKQISKAKDNVKSKRSNSIAKSSLLSIGNGIQLATGKLTNSVSSFLNLAATIG